MVDFSKKDMGNRRMTCKIDEVHLDEEGSDCPTTGTSPRSDQIHIVLEPTDQDWKSQNWWLYDTLAQDSALHEVVKKFMDLGVITEKEITDADTTLELFQIIEGNLDGDEFVVTEKRIGRSVSEKWFPKELA